MARPPRWQATLDASVEEACLAVRLYNDPAESRSFEGFVIHMHLAWLYLLHAEFIRERIARGGGTAPAPAGGPGSGIKHDSFLKMSIPDATKKLLDMKRVKQSTQEVMDALEQGGLPRSKYNTVYSILSRREKQIGDIINMKGDWALAEWYPNHRPKAKAPA